MTFGAGRPDRKSICRMRTPLRCGRRSLGTSTQRERCRAAGAAARERRRPSTRDTTRRLCARGRPGRALRSTPADAPRQMSWSGSGRPATELTASDRRVPTGRPGITAPRPSTPVEPGPTSVTVDPGAVGRCLSRHPTSQRVEGGARDRESERGVQGGQPGALQLLSQSNQTVHQHVVHLSSYQALPSLQGVRHRFVGGSLAGKDCNPHSSTMSVDGLVASLVLARPRMSPSTSLPVRLRASTAAARISIVAAWRDRTSGLSERVRCIQHSFHRGVPIQHAPEFPLPPRCRPVDREWSRLPTLGNVAGRCLGRAPSVGIPTQQHREPGVRSSCGWLSTATP